MCSFFPGLASGLCVAKVIGLADSRESPDIYIHSRTDINPLRRHAHPASISGKIGGSEGLFRNITFIGERERANLVVQLARFLLSGGPARPHTVYSSKSAISANHRSRRGGHMTTVYIIYPGAAHTVMFYVVLNMHHVRKRFCITHRMH